MQSAFQSRVFSIRLGLDFEILRRAILDRGAFFVVGGWAHFSLAVLFILLHISGRQFAIWTDAPNPFRRRGLVKGIARRLWLRFLFGAASNVMGTGVLALRNLKELGCPEKKLVNFPCGPDLDVYKAIVSNDLDSPKIGARILLSSGRIVNSHKGFDLAIRALASLKQRQPALQIRYRIAGDGPDRVALEQLATELRVRNLVDFLGWLQPSELPSFYRSGHYFVHPAHFEPYGIVVVEAMAAGLIVVASDQTGAAIDRLEDRKSGFLHRTGSADDLTDVLVRALAVPPEQEARMRALSLASGMAWPANRLIEIVKTLAASA